MGSNPENETVPNRALGGATSTGETPSPSSSLDDDGLSGAPMQWSNELSSKGDYRQDTHMYAIAVYKALIARIEQSEKVSRENIAKLQKETKEALGILSKEIEEKVEKSRVSFIETIGIFVALFTFISIEFNVFRIYSEWKAVVGLTLTLLGSIAFLVLIFHSFILLTARIGAEKYRWGLIEGLTTVFSLSLIAGGALLVAFAPMEMDDSMGTSIDTRVQTATQAEWQGTHDALTDVQNEVEAVNTRLDAGDARLRECVKKFGVVRQCFE